jgi:hypothetical protein
MKTGTEDRILLTEQFGSADGQLQGILLELFQE